MTILRLSTLSLTVAIAVITLGYAVPSVAVKPVCPGPHPSCSGDNDPGVETPVAATFACPNASPTDRDCPNALTPHRVQGDMNVSYMDGVQDVTAHIRDTGVLQLRTDAKGEKPGERNLYWDFGSGLMLSSGLLLTTTDGLPEGYGHATVIQVGRGAGGLDFRTLDIGESAATNLWANLILKPNKGPKEFVFIRFEDPDVGDQCPDSSGATPITVQRLSATSWEVSGGDTATACIQGASMDVVLGPFSFEVQEL